jgi:hypothetical protein
MSKQNVFSWAMAVWLAFLVLAVGMGAARDAFLAPVLDDRAARLVETLAFVAVMLVLIAFFVRRVRAVCSSTDLWLIGGMWLALTVGFELFFFHFVGGRAWDVLLADFNVFEGRVWVLVPLAELFGPPTFGRLMRSH